MSPWWIAELVLVCVGIAAAIVATATGRHWWVAPAAAPVILGVALQVAGVAVPTNPLAIIGLGLGVIALAVLGGNPVVALVLRLATRTVRLGTHGGILVTDVDSPLPDREILRGGTTIGYLERLALVGTILVGQPAAIAVIVAVKGLGRFSELENAAARERFIIGTLASLAWAAACTGILTVTW